MTVVVVVMVVVVGAVMVVVVKAMDTRGPSSPSTGRCRDQPLR